MIYRQIVHIQYRRKCFFLYLIQTYFFACTTCRQIVYMPYEQKTFVHMRYGKIVHTICREIVHMQYRQSYIFLYLIYTKPFVCTTCRQIVFTLFRKKTFFQMRYRQFVYMWSRQNNYVYIKYIYKLCIFVIDSFLSILFIDNTYTYDIDKIKFST